MKLIIAGGRNFDDYALLTNEVETVIVGESHVEIVSGGAKGADRLGEFFAIDHDLDIKRFPADWDKHGKAAGYKRNSDMADYADTCICFWDGKSKGTGHMIQLAKNKGLKLTVIVYGV